MIRSVGFAMIAAVLLLTDASGAQEISYSGKTISLIVSSGVGGGHEVYARALATRLSSHLPGDATIVVKHMVGAGGRIAAEYIANRAPDDGTEFASLPPEAVFTFGERIGYSISDLAPLGSALAGMQVCITGPNAAVKRFSDTATMPLVLGTSGSGSSTTNLAHMVRNLTHRNAQIKMVGGYTGVNDIALAIDRGEVDGMCGLEWTSLISIRPEWVEKKTVHVILKTGIDPTATISGWHERIEDMREFMDPSAQAVADYIVLGQGMSRPYFAPARTNAAYLRVLRQAILDTWSDPLFLEDAKKMHIDIAPMRAEQAEILMRRAAAAPPDLIEKARKAVEE